MKQLFDVICKAIFPDLEADEHLGLSLGGEASTYVRINGATIRQAGNVDECDLGFNLIKEKKRATGSISLSGDESADVKRARTELLRLRKEVTQLPDDPYLVIPNSKETSNSVQSGDLPEPEDIVAGLLPPMGEIDLTGIWASGMVFRGSANSAGGYHWFASDSFSLDCSLITAEERMVKATFAGTEWDPKAYEAFLKDSVAKLEVMKLPPKKIAPGNYRTFIASAGVADVLGMFSWGGISEASIRQGESALGKMRNESIHLSKHFTLSEDFSAGTTPRFNSNGEVAPLETVLIESGELKGTLVNTRTAKEYGIETNYADDEEGLRAPVMSSGELAEANVLKQLGTGVYLSNLHYLNWSDRMGGRITGMTRYACFWVEDGEIVAPIENMRFDDSIYNFLGENLEAVTDKALINPDVGTYEGRNLSSIVCPGILLKSFALTL
ncbi:MAG: TldD/PmbA family protein [Candidatus Marinimicrobia bacterium]|nr:TldD/PmbA family protein [Candidatus Neomarinimicrobiota bacterium]MCF7851362.1 TldD/PmbA family protein [Candidatus Neomarinimicrobiota bacterium]MCF7904196.1 TldD/PmbA family protein [Candidatus Neomarinimicrobiota bacterium]